MIQFSVGARAAFVVLGLLAGGSTLAAASGTLDAGLAAVVLDNGHERDCIEEATGLCVIAARLDSPQDAFIDLDQRFHFVGVVVDGDAINALLPVAVLPDSSLMIDSTDLRIRHPVLRILTETVGNQSAPSPFQKYGIILTPQGNGFHYFGPHPFAPTGEWGHYAFYPDYSKKGGVGYEHVGFPSDMQNVTTDEQLRILTEFSCIVVEDCAVFDEAHDAYESRTPNANIGFALFEAGAGLDRETFRGPPRGEKTAQPGAIARGPLGAFHLPRAFDVGAATALPPMTAMPPGGPSDEPPAAERAPVPRAPAAAPESPNGPAGEPNALAIAAAAAFALAIAAAALYARIGRGHKRLRTGQRARLLELLAARDAPTVAELARDLDIDRVTVVHHARVLARARLVAIHRVGREVRVSLAGRPIPTARPLATERVLTALSAAGGSLPRQGLADALSDLPQRTRNHAVKSLLSRGAIADIGGSLRLVGDAAV